MSGRISLLPARRFSADEFEYLLFLAMQDGFVTRPSTGVQDNGVRSLNGTEIVRLTLAGEKFLEENRATLIETWIANILGNVPTIITSVAAGMLLAYLLSKPDALR